MANHPASIRWRNRSRRAGSRPLGNFGPVRQVHGNCCPAPACVRPDYGAAETTLWQGSELQQPRDAWLNKLHPNAIVVLSNGVLDAAFHDDCINGTLCVCHDAERENSEQNPNQLLPESGRHTTLPFVAPPKQTILDLDCCTIPISHSVIICVTIQGRAWT